MRAQPYTVTEVEAELARRRKARRPLSLLILLFALMLVFALLYAVYFAIGLLRTSTPYFPDPVDHFKYGSIGAEPNSGIPKKIWNTLPILFPEAFEGKYDYSAFGFLYDYSNGKRRELPVGISERKYLGVNLVWFNCAVCHTGTYREVAGGSTKIVPAMPSNNLDLHKFIKFILNAGTDERMAPDRLIEAMEKSGQELGFVDKLYWKYLVIPQVREGLILRSGRVLSLLERQPAWGPGRVDTFNPYKVVQMSIPTSELSKKEVVGASDFPSIFLQGPREDKDMKLHWDGNNASLDERNLSAAIGAGVTPETIDHSAIRRVAKWLMDLEPPKNQRLKVDDAKIQRGQGIYMDKCAACHGYQGTAGYKFEGRDLGKVEPIDRIGTDPARLNSYTKEFQQRQLNELFAGTPYQFKHFRKTNGYANMPLDGLWLRGPYLHNGAVPTLADLLLPVDQRPRSFWRGSDLLDFERGGFFSPPCDTPDRPVVGFCFEVDNKPGNGNGGHLYGVDLTKESKSDLLAYLMTF